MRVRSIPPARSPGAAVGALALAAGLLTGCALINPYVPVQPGVVQDDAASVAASNAMLAALGLTAEDPLAGGAGPALLKLAAQREAMFDKLRSVGVTRSMSSVVTLGASSLGVYNALRPLPATSGGSAGLSDADRRRAGQLALLAGASYSLGQYFVNPEQESVYAEGANALTCLMVQAAPLLISKDRLDTFEGQLKALDKQLKAQQERIAEMKLLLAQGQRAGGSTNDADAVVLRKLINEAEAAAARGRSVAADGRVLAHRYRAAGQAIGGASDLITTMINVQLRERNRPMSELKASLMQAAGISEAFKDFAAESSEDDDATPGAGAAAMPSDPAATLMLLAWPASAVPWFGSAVVAWLGAAGTATATAAAPAQAASNAQAKPAPAKPAQAKPAASKAAPPLDKAISAQIEALIKATEQAATQAKRLAELQKQSADAARIEEAEKRVQQAEKKLKDQQEEFSSAKWKQVIGDDLSKELLKHGMSTEALYAARRPVLHALIAVRAHTKTVLEVPQCAGGTLGLRVHPSGDRSANAGDVLSFVASDSRGSPRVFLQGNPGALKSGKENLQVESLGGTTKFTLTLGEDAPSGTVLLVATDDKGLQSQTVRVKVRAKSEPKPKKSEVVDAAVKAEAAASAAAGAAAKAADAAAAAAAKAKQAN